ncbi:hypothetical protein NPX79_01180 [Spiroplasma endosymbiont of Anurida maritima]|uniref:hypothetical protein n=1 Tax=Spiroplasma endosymbiont of Anurida maritima TaxID=2967972 RepID=UPI0036D316CC
MQKKEPTINQNEYDNISFNNNENNNENEASKTNIFSHETETHLYREDILDKLLNSNEENFYDLLEEYEPTMDFEPNKSTNVFDEEEKTNFNDLEMEITKEEVVEKSLTPQNELNKSKKQNNNSDYNIQENTSSHLLNEIDDKDFFEKEKAFLKSQNEKTSKETKEKFVVKKLSNKELKNINFVQDNQNDEITKEEIKDIYKTIHNDLNFQSNQRAIVKERPVFSNEETIVLDHNIDKTIDFDALTLHETINFEDNIFTKKAKKATKFKTISKDAISSLTKEINIDYLTTLINGLRQKNQNYEGLTLLPFYLKSIAKALIEEDIEQKDLNIFMKSLKFDAPQKTFFAKNSEDIISKNILKIHKDFLTNNLEDDYNSHQPFISIINLGDLNAIDIDLSLEKNENLIIVFSKINNKIIFDKNNKPIVADFITVKVIFNNNEVTFNTVNNFMENIQKFLLKFTHIK